MRAKALDMLVCITRRFAPRTASAARYARSQGREHNANEADREVHDFLAHTDDLQKKSSMQNTFLYAR